MIRSLFSFLARNPWVFVPLAFLALIGVWVAYFVLASGVDTSEVPYEKPAHLRKANP